MQNLDIWSTPILPQRSPPGEINVTLTELRWLKRFRDTNISLGVNKTVEDEIEIASSE